jgi:hypothetical protein
MNYVLAGIVVLVLAYVYISRVSVNKKYAEDLPGVYFLYEDGSPCFHFYESSDGKVWYYDFGRNFHQPAPYDNMEQLKKAIKPRIGGWKYKIIPVLLLALCFSVFSCQVSYARDIEDYQRMAEEYKPVIEKLDAVHRIENIFNKHVSEHLVESKNLFLKAILLWQLVGFYREVYELEVSGKAPWMRRD